MDHAGKGSPKPDATSLGGIEVGARWTRIGHELRQRHRLAALEPVQLLDNGDLLAGVKYRFVVAIKAATPTSSSPKINWTQVATTRRRVARVASSRSWLKILGRYVFTPG